MKNKVERLIQQASDLKDLKESYSEQMTTKVRESRHIELGSKLNEASTRFNIEGTRYYVMKGKVE